MSITIWEPNGYKVISESFEARCGIPEETLDYRGEIIDAGWRPFHSIEFYESRAFSLEAFRHPEKGLLVFGIGELCGAFYIFVDDMFIDIFMVSEYLRIYKSLCDIDSCFSIKYLVKTIAAFVRHGNGTSVISEDGDENREEAERRKERYRSMKEDGQ